MKELKSWFRESWLIQTPEKHTIFRKQKPQAEQANSNKAVKVVHLSHLVDMRKKFNSVRKMSYCLLYENK